MIYVPFEFARTAIINILKSTDLNQVDVIPSGFNNSIRWNAGHALVIADKILKHSSHFDHHVPDHYSTFFDMGTKPAEWKQEPPSVEEIIDMSNQQLTETKKLLENHWDSPLTSPFDLRGNLFSTVPELVGFITYHEGMHFDASKLILRAIKS